MYSIGELSRRTGVKVTTIRYYEQMGLISAPSRTEGNQRRYAKRELERLSFIRHARDLGFSLDDVKEFVTMSDEHGKACDKAHFMAARHLESVRQKIARLKRMEKELNRIAAVIDGGSVDKCRVIEALSDHSLCESEH